MFCDAVIIADCAKSARPFWRFLQNRCSSRFFTEDYKAALPFGRRLLSFFHFFRSANEWQAEDVSSQNLGYDIRSVNKLDIKRYIEVKGRSGIDGVMLSENEMNRLAQLGNSAWLYIVVNCKSKPQLHRIQNPAKKLIFERKDKGVQYYLPLDEWRNKTEK